MPDLPTVVWVAVFVAGLAAAAVGVAAICSGRNEELTAGLDQLLPPAEPEQDFVDGRAAVDAMSPQEIEDRLRAIVAAEKWKWKGRHRRPSPRRIPRPVSDDVYDLDGDGACDG